MRLDLQRDSKEWRAFSDFYKLYNEMGGVEPIENTAYWDERREKIDKFRDEYGGSRLGDELFIALINLLSSEDYSERMCRVITEIAFMAVEDDNLAHRLYEVANNVQKARKAKGKE